MNRSFTVITQRGNKLEELLTVYLITDYHIRKIAPLTVNFWTYKAESCNPYLPTLPENMSPKYILATSSYRPIEIFTKKRVARREQSKPSKPRLTGLIWRGPSDWVWPSTDLTQSTYHREKKESVNINTPRKTNTAQLQREIEISVRDRSSCVLHGSVMRSCWVQGLGRTWDKT